MRHYLLVDDNEAFAENMAEIISDAGAKVSIATTGARAIELARTTRFDALVSDMKMPVMNGAKVVHEIRRLDPGLPAIVVTAYTGDDDLAAARQEGLMAVLPKPVPVERLLQLLQGARRNGLVAIIEDDVSLLDNLCEMLRDRGFSAVTATSIIETDRLGPIAPFAALVDVRIPGGASGEALRVVSSRFPGLPQLVITGFPEEVQGAGQEVFLKPFATEKLMATLERLHGAAL